MARTGTKMDDTALAAKTPIRAQAGSRTAVSLVSDNRVAFALRAASAQAASRTLDLQYYSWDEDVTGRLLARGSTPSGRPWGAGAAAAR